MEFYVLCTILHENTYSFKKSQKGRDLWSFLFKRLPQIFPHSDCSFKLTLLLACFDSIITYEELYDKTNLEIVILPSTFENIFGFNHLHCSDLVDVLLKCLDLHCKVPSPVPITLKASWTYVGLKRPFLQRIVQADTALNPDASYYLSNELMRIFHMQSYSRKYLAQETVRGYWVKELIIKQVRQLRFNVTNKNPSILHCGGTFLSTLGESDVIHVSQIDRLLVYHCSTVPVFPKKHCDGCNCVM